MNGPLTIRLSSFALLSATVLALVFLALVGNRVLDGELQGLQFYADSATYEKAAEEPDATPGLSRGLVRVEANYLGPVLLLRAVGGNRWAVLLINCALVAFGFALVARSFGFDRPTAIALLLASPLMLSSLISVNKEVFGFLSVCLLLHGLRVRSLIAIAAALLFAMFARWQAAVFVVAFLGMLSPLNPFRRHRIVSFVALLLGMTVVYPQFLGVFALVQRVADEGAATNSGSGLFTIMIEIQNHYGYFLVFLPKLAHLMFGMLAKAPGMFGYHDFYNDVMLVWQAAVSLVVFLLLAIRNRLRLTDPFVYASLVYAAVFVLTPVFSPRYLLPVFVLWCFAAAARPQLQAFGGPQVLPQRGWI